MTWELAAFAITFLIAGISTIIFSRFSAKAINRKIEDSNHFYMCVDDKIGYTLLSMGFAILLPRNIAYKIVPGPFLDVDIVKKSATYPRDKILAFFHCGSVLIFLLFIAINAAADFS